MNYYNFVNTILETAKSHKLVYEVGEGDIYEHLNSGDHKYPCVFLTVQNVDSNGDQMTVTGSLFYVDALLSDTSNKLQIQSTGMTTLQQIFMRLMDNYPDFDLRTGRYTPFDEKFADLCAGVFSNFTVSFMDDICIVNDDIFEGDEPYIPEQEGKYMTITVLDGTEGTVIEPIVKGNISPNLQYRINNGKWNDYVFGQTSAIHSVVGDVVQWKGNNPDGLSTSISNRIIFAISGNSVALSGNLMSLIDGKGETKVIPCNYCFNNLFRDSTIKTISSDFLPATTFTESCYVGMFWGCTSLENAPELPAITLARSCYDGMFSRCTALTTAPELPAITLTYSCYRQMFYGCTALTTAPQLHATTLAVNCYFDMFNGCTALTTSPELPATTLAANCYFGMFKGCTALTTAPELHATTIARSCYFDMFNGCTALTTAPELPATILSERCYGGMFQGCTALTTAPELPATTLAERCYSWMFYGCTALTTAPELPATTLAANCYSVMFSGCTSLTTAPELPATTLADSCYDGMFEKCYNLNYLKCLATDITATDALTDWLSGVAPTGTFVKKYGVEFLINSPSGIPQGWTVEEIDAPIPEPKYMTITVDDSVEGEAVIRPNVTGSLPNLNLQYRINNGNWNDFIVGTTADIHVVAGDAVQFKGLNTDGIPKSYNNYLNFYISDLCHLSGNVMSLIDGVGDTKEIPCDYCFYQMFSNSKIKTVSSDFLPATTLANNCYNRMFWKCTALVNAPVLHATTLAESCYEYMFSGCTSLTTAPVLPSTTLAEGCYFDMFNGCTALTTSPELPATTLKEFCYSYMFEGCTSLVNTTELPATTLVNYCYQYMFYKCSSLTQSPELHATNLASGCYNSMFSGCTSLTTAPVLPATITHPGCYSGMFEDCTSLTKAPELPATKLAKSCYSSMFYGCTSLTTAPELPATSLEPYCYYRMFYNCKNLKKAPELPATTLLLGCYSDMFWECRKLNYVKCLATEGTIGIGEPSTDSLYTWLRGVSTSGKFVKSAGVSYEKGISGIPEGWTVEEIAAPTPVEGKYMTITVDEQAGETVIEPKVKGGISPNLQYRINNGDWNDFIFGQTGAIHVVAGDVVQWKGYNPDGLSGSAVVSNDKVYISFSISDLCHLSGSVMSLIDGKGETDTIPCEYCFHNLFANSKIKTVSSDFLHATYLRRYCYYQMFLGCENLTQAPDLPAIELVDSCYENMFLNCKSLVQAPILNSTSLKSYCYSRMFYGCSKLNYVKTLAVEGIVDSHNINPVYDSLHDWLLNVSHTGTFVKPAGVSYETGSSGIPDGWTIEEI